MGITWIPGVERLGDGSIGGDMDSPTRPGRAVWHTTESGDGNAAFNAVANYLIEKTAEPHILYDPTTDRIGQFGPLDKSARALRNDGTTRTNRTGKVCIQIEVLARAGKPFTAYWKPGPNFIKLMAAIRSWGIPDTFPMGALAASYNDTNAKRTRSVWLNEGGHYGHCNVPGNDHWDPGAISQPAIFKAAPVTVPKPTPPAKPVVSVARINAARAKDIPAATGHKTYPKDVLIVERALNAEGLLSSTWVDGSWGSKTQDGYDAFRRRMGYTGADAEGSVGKGSLTKLAKRHGFLVVD